MADRSELIDEMLRTAKTIAVVGMSNKQERASFHIGAYLAKNGYRVVVMPMEPGAGNRSAADPYYDPVWARLNEAGVVVTYHVAEARFMHLPEKAEGDVHIRGRRPADLGFGSRRYEGRRKFRQSFSDERRQADADEEPHVSSLADRVGFRAAAHFTLILWNLGLIER